MSENNFKLHEKIISDAAGKIASHREFKAAYNQELAFDFDPFRFFKVGENKISEILAAFLKPDERHGQGELFLKDFTERLEQKLHDPIYLNDKQSESVTIDSKVIEQYRNAIQELSKTRIHIEKPLDKHPDRNGRRRIDIYIPLGGYAIAVENKVWASDQKEQIKDYRSFLLKNHQKGHILIYLTPYGHKPDDESLSKNDWDSGVKDGSLVAMSYKHDILPMLESWEAKCKAERVRFFIREFKNHLHVKFLGGNRLNMTKALEEIIRKDSETVKALAGSYQALEKNAKEKIDEVAKRFKPLNTEEMTGVQFTEPFPSSAHFYVFKLSLKADTTENEKKVEQIFVHLSEKNLRIGLTYYIKDRTSSNFSDHIRKVWEDDLSAAEELFEEQNRGGNGEAILFIKPEISAAQIAGLMNAKVALFKKAIQDYDGAVLIEN